MTGPELRQFRQSLKLSQRELADILGVQRVTITRAEGDAPSRMLQALLDQALARGQLKIPTEPPKKQPRKKRK
jgi:transcriptional regulator with XRE-family HTH domain